ncbi:hypothetical protein E2R68_05785 [Psychromonas sp. RZ22]|uniref:chalcone isomerase family protein n=1 Tax=Psychromonas algarum TaxID=2555643 RepID=UPI001067BE42|nr:chalcone isomerase family protein [Psychromonas sp. RZ22]TEW55265.1 hypothetical protein E2R68_05785 [Psychromonas sp. RZ22]
MRKRMLYLPLILFITIISVASTAHAEWHKQLNFEQETNFKNVGSTTYSIFIWDLYNSKLLTTSGAYPMQSEDAKLLYEIEYLKDVSSKDLVNHTVKQWQHLDINRSEYEHYLPRLASIWPNIKAGDRLTLVMNKSSSAFYYNSDMVGVIDKPEFGPLFLDIWLSENTSEPKLREELLGINKNG